MSKSNSSNPLLTLGKRYAKALGKKKKIEEDLAAANIEIAKLQSMIVEKFTNLGLQSLNVKGVGTVFLQRFTWAKPLGEREAICSALLEEGLGDLVKTKTDFNTNSLSSWVREYIKENEGEDGSLPDLPGKLKELVGVTTGYEARFRSAN